MNYLNGGYIMVKHDATQAELQKAFESKRPVIAYDSDNRGQFATISESGGTYTLTLLKDGANGGALYAVDIYGKGNDNYMHHITVFVDDLTLETYADVVTYLQNKGYSGYLFLVACQVIVESNTKYTSGIQEDGNGNIIDMGGNEIANDEDFSITYLGN